MVGRLWQSENGEAQCSAEVIPMSQQAHIGWDTDASQSFVFPAHGHGYQCCVILLLACKSSVILPSFILPHSKLTTFSIGL